jgi:hypothetical protein
MLAGTSFPPKQALGVVRLRLSTARPPQRSAISMRVAPKNGTVQMDL